MKDIYRLNKVYSFVVFPLFFSYLLFAVLFMEGIEKFIHLIVLLMFISIVIRSAYKIEIAGDLLSFYTVLGKKEIEVKDINSIKETMFSIELKHNNGKFYISCLFDKYTGFKSFLKKVPDIRFES